ncbi:type I secretion system permease/ATPase [Tsuneonella sp. HG222]
MDPLLSCIDELARRYGFALSPSEFDLLPRDEAGRLPFHQAGAALEAAGLNFEKHTKTQLPTAGSLYPLLVLTQDRGPLVVHERNETDMLVWLPETGTATWEPAERLKGTVSAPVLSVAGNPDRLREESAPWHAKGRHHWFWSELRKERQALRPILLGSLIVNLLALSLPLFSMNVYDRVIPNKAAETLWVLAIGVLLAFALEFALKRARANVLDELGRRLDMRLSQKIFGRMLSMPLSARTGSTGGMVSRFSEYTIVREFFASTTILLIVDIAFLFIFIGLIAYIAGWLAIIPVIAMAVMAAAGFVLQRKVIDAARDMQADYGLQQTLLVEAIAGSETIKSMNGEVSAIGRWHALADIGSHSQIRLKNITAIAVGLATSFQQISTVLLVIGGYYLFAAGQITMGAIIAIVMLSSRSLAPAGQIAFLLTRGRQALESIRTIEELFERDDERRLETRNPPAIPRAARIKVEGLDFSYPQSESRSLEGIDLQIEPGERIALIGRVASGKSTLGRLLCGLYQPTAGAILLDGIDSRQFRPHDLRREFRFVGQDATLFTGSIRDNLTLSDRSLPDEKLHEALRISGADAFLARDAKGFDRAIGDQGRTLSGGQRSFLSLARAFVSPAQLLFLDEPTGAMDSETERFFVDRLRASLAKDQTLVIATHRPALFAICDRIIVLDKGRIVADGPKAQLLAGSAGELAA